ncbi:hypothetical protein Pfo_011517 [Paulownia fortunei]|nr:hypothetical protein Pfo_011517 [Paulownia fortunei]
MGVVSNDSGVLRVAAHRRQLAPCTYTVRHQVSFVAFLAFGETATLVNMMGWQRSSYKESSSRFEISEKENAIEVSRFKEKVARLKEEAKGASKDYAKLRKKYDHETKIGKKFLV